MGKPLTGKISFIHSEVIDIFFQLYHPGIFMLDAMQNPCKLFLVVFLNQLKK